MPSTRCLTAAWSQCCDDTQTRRCRGESDAILSIDIPKIRHSTPGHAHHAPHPLGSLQGTSHLQNAVRSRSAMRSSPKVCAESDGESGLTPRRCVGRRRLGGVQIRRPRRAGSIRTERCGRESSARYAPGRRGRKTACAGTFHSIRLLTPHCRPRTRAQT